MTKVTFEKNIVGRDFVVGDLHGCYDDFMEALKTVEFDRKTDRVFSVGDLVDRGPHSLECLELIRVPWFHSILGNHEYMMLYERGLHCMNGGTWRFLVDDQHFVDLTAECGQLPLAIEVTNCRDEKIGIVHAEPGFDWDSIKEYDIDTDRLLWSRERYYSKGLGDVYNIDAVVTGHTIVKDPTWRDNVLYIETAAFMKYGYELGAKRLDLNPRIMLLNIDNIHAKERKVYDENPD